MAPAASSLGGEADSPVGLTVTEVILRALKDRAGKDIERGLAIVAVVSWIIMAIGMFIRRLQCRLSNLDRLSIPLSRRQWSRHCER